MTEFSMADGRESEDRPGWPYGDASASMLLGGRTDVTGNRRLGLVGVGALLLLWAVAGPAGLIDELILPGPWATVGDFWDLATEGFQRATLWEHLGASLLRMVLGLGLGGVAGLVAGLAIGSSRTIRSIVQPAFGFFRRVSVFGVMPMLVFVWIGPGIMRIVTLLSLTTFFIVAVAVRDHVAGRGPVPDSAPDRVDLRTLRQALPATFLALRVAAAVNWNVLVAGELISSQKGLGAMIWTARTFFQYGYIVVAIIVLVGASALVDLALRRLGERLAQ